MSTTPLRAAMVPVTRQMRAYFAPVNRVNETPTIFDPGQSGAFLLASPPDPWLDLGWIENFERWYETPTDTVRTGVRSMPAAQFRGALEARVEFDFCQWGKLQMALAGGSEHMNVLAPMSGSISAAPSGGLPAPAVAVLAGSTASEVILGAGATGSFPAGCLIAVDVDYQQQIGYVGSGIAAAYVSGAAAVKQDPNYVRRVTFNVGRVAEVTATSVLLAQPLLGGAPAAGASAQVVVAFVDREGGSFFQEWSALFVAQEESGGRVCFYYPRLSASSAGKTAGKGLREGFAAVAKAVSAISLRASFLALPYTDGNDGQTVLCYRSYFPAAQAGVY
ncbi:MAG TPA: hypothetical protein VE377_13205 [Candidatus Dormibacteraeota bacterium]|nr:hypothetical protein [Candidatus Dormibacteraeota bacterium]